MSKPLKHINFKDFKIDTATIKTVCCKNATKEMEKNHNVRINLTD